MTKYEATITMTLEFKRKTTEKEVTDCVLAAMWGTRMTTQEGAQMDDFKVEAKEKR